jgi:AraC-like DNA-binding protein
VANHAELALQLEGTHVLELGRARHLVDGATIVVHPAGEEYLRASPSALPQRSTHLFLVGELERALGRARGPRTLPSSPRVALLLACTRRAEAALEVHQAALELAGAILEEIVPPRQLPVPPERHSWRRLTEDARHQLAARLGERVTLDAVAQACGASPFHLCRVFRAVTGDTLHRHLTRLRLRAALLQLDDRCDDLTGLALSLGFSSHSHFTAAFRREYGVTPSATVGQRRPGRARSAARRAGPGTEARPRGA